MSSLCLAWTTVATRPEADQLAAAAVAAGLAACVQVDGPVTAHYLWEGRTERADEFRLCFKFDAERQGSLEAWLMARHPYATPEWVVVQADHVAQKYLSWARSGPKP